MKIRSLMVRFALLTGLLSLALSAQADALANFLARLQQLQSLEADFTQVTRDNAGRTLQQLNGTLTVAKPGKMRWQTAAPYEQLVVSDGELVWIYDMDLEQVTIRNMDLRVQETPALLLSGDSAQVGQNFTVAESLQGDFSRYQLTPKDRSQLFEKLEFQYQQQQLESMRIYDAAGQITEIVFARIKTNKPTDHQAFIFDVPEGVDVIDGRHEL
ncbi:outer membrane lipoprotein chaperone LolA [Venatoribacter cucullus]|uniref:Outer-membrane lipoprotein carrier protein n=1 Tax=Venatoribacter cucullus TaxID=2661630 RepID=A0A9X7UWC8_9GAMM|nr:outer membrane lipoprotein chaperone LolA [Venatoribacter cucullus]QQD21445.1 outer membrane lipoprotein chaperone LolA [Oceanospirillaceae bacterium ASx5O]QQD24123.1 outer membrane lipoprotein chaperone LolA [Venatoribacter cucullus]